MENKYYLPKIDEFHIGFEYWLKSKEPTSTKRVPIIIKNFSDVQDAIRCFAFDDIVVKHLSKEDIESFGFKLFENMPSRFHYNKYELDVDYLNVIRIEYDCNYIFKGKIKNKSELKKLLIQLEIINE